MYLCVMSLNRSCSFHAVTQGTAQILWSIKPWFYCIVSMEKSWGTGKVLKARKTIRQRKKTKIWKKLFPPYFNGSLPLVRSKQKINSWEYKFKHFKLLSTQSHNHVYPPKLESRNFAFSGTLILELRTWVLFFINCWNNQVM